MIGNRLNHVICCGTRSDSDVEDMGLVMGHAYTIVNRLWYSYKSSISQESC